MSRAICSALSLLGGLLSDAAELSESWTKTSLFFKACSLENKGKQMAEAAPVKWSDDIFGHFGVHF